ncbi:hypothetical protein [uncultured Bacteroides sp.]|uniref:hypothetical protein n=1 Tax=uncultured Bacteroides sp. TaxID=162156 RepID=UPI00280AE4FC|nr:hypothetical protein [uncultured Bacteroides sp.]
MKQLKFLMVAFTLLTGISLTSCMGESDPTVGGTFVMKVTDPYTYSFKFYGSDIKYTAANPSQLTGLTLNSGDIVQIAWSYNSEEQPVTEQTKEVKVTVSGIQNLSTAARSRVSGNTGEDYENATIRKVGFISDYGSSNNGITYFDEKTILIPVVFLYNSDDLSKHQFTLVYDNSEIPTDDSTLNLYLRYYTSDEEVKADANIYKAFDITQALGEFNTATGGKTPTKIKVWANEGQKTDSNSLDDAKEELQSYEVEYSFKSDTNN